MAVHLARKHGAEVAPALVAIEEASSQAARELRSTLEVLRDEAPPRGPRLDEVAGLIEGTGRAGVAATVTVDGVPAPLPAEVDGAAYRIIQEALTNVARHTAPASAAVRLAFTPEALTVQVVDDQPLIRAGFTALLEAEDDVHVVGEAEDGRAALAVVAEHRPDVVLLDVQMPVLDGIGATRAIASDPPCGRVASACRSCSRRSSSKGRTTPSFDSKYRKNARFEMPAARAMSSTVTAS